MIFGGAAAADANASKPPKRSISFTFTNRGIQHTEKGADATGDKENALPNVPAAPVAQEVVTGKRRGSFSAVIGGASVQAKAPESAATVVQGEREPATKRQRLSSSRGFIPLGFAANDTGDSPRSLAPSPLTLNVSPSTVPALRRSLSAASSVDYTPPAKRDVPSVFARNATAMLAADSSVAGRVEERYVAFLELLSEHRRTIASLEAKNAQLVAELTGVRMGGRDGAFGGVTAAASRILSASPAPMEGVSEASGTPRADPAPSSAREQLLVPGAVLFRTGDDASVGGSRPASASGEFMIGVESSVPMIVGVRRAFSSSSVAVGGQGLFSTHAGGNGSAALVPKMMDYALPGDDARRRASLASTSTTDEMPPVTETVVAEAPFAEVAVPGETQCVPTTGDEDDDEEDEDEEDGKATAEIANSGEQPAFTPPTGDSAAVSDDLVVVSTVP